MARVSCYGDSRTGIKVRVTIRVRVTKPKES
jgi:hypothetical protein